MIYEIEIPKASAKRLESNRKLICYLWTMGRKVVRKTWSIPDGEAGVRIEFNEPLKHEEPMELDGDFHHTFEVLYSNSTGSRTETQKVTPTPCSK